MFSRLFQYFESMIDPLTVAENPAPPKGLKEFYKYFLVQIWPLISVACVVSAIAAFIDAMLPVAIGWTVDLFSKSSPETVWQDGQSIFLIILAIVIARPIVGLMQLLISLHAQFPGFTNLIRWQSHHHVSRQSLHFFQSDFAGRIANKVMQTGMALRSSVMSVQDSIWYVVAFLFSALFFIGNASLYLTIPVLIWLGSYLSILTIFLPRIRKQAAIMSEVHSMLTGRIVDSYTNIQTVKLFAGNDFEDEFVASGIKEHTVEIQNLFRYFTYMWVSLHVINGVLLVGVGGTAIYLWQQSIITIGEVAMVLPLVLQLKNMATWMMEIANGVFENTGTVEEGMETISKSHSVTDEKEAKELKILKGKIEFKNVDFDYGDYQSEDSDRNLAVIKSLDLTIQPGQKIGLVGRSGAGKSTLVNLVLRLYDLKSGKILIDDQDISKVTQQSLRRQIGMVTQDTSLLHRSIRDNLIYGTTGATEEDMMIAATRAEAIDFINDLSDGKGGEGFDTLVGDRGVKLSGGQRQRIAIARVLLKNAPILILDEATSALDSEVEAMIQRQLTSMMESKTVIAIAHRLSTIAEMDRLIIMDKGKIVEDGSHEDLISRKDGIYAKLWARQSGGFLGADKEEELL